MHEVTYLEFEIKKSIFYCSINYQHNGFVGIEISFSKATFVLMWFEISAGISTFFIGWNPLGPNQLRINPFYIYFIFFCFCVAVFYSLVLTFDYIFYNISEKIKYLGSIPDKLVI